MCSSRLPVVEGHYQVTTRILPGQYQASTRLLPGQYQAIKGALLQLLKSTIIVASATLAVECFVITWYIRMLGDNTADTQHDISGGSDYNNMLNTAAESVTEMNTKRSVT